MSSSFQINERHSLYQYIYTRTQAKTEIEDDYLSLKVSALMEIEQLTEECISRASVTKCDLYWGFNLEGLSF